MTKENMDIEIHGESAGPGRLSLGLPENASASEFEARGKELLREVALAARKGEHVMEVNETDVHHHFAHYCYDYSPRGETSFEATRDIQMKATVGILCLLQSKLNPSDEESLFDIQVLEKEDFDCQRVNRQEVLKVHYHGERFGGSVLFVPKTIEAAQKLEAVTKEVQDIFSSHYQGSERIEGNMTVDDEIAALSKFPDYRVGPPMIAQARAIAQRFADKLGPQEDVEPRRSITDFMMDGYGVQAKALVQSGYPASVLHLLTDTLFQRSNIRHPSFDEHVHLAEAIAGRIARMEDRTESFTTPFMINSSRLLRDEIEDVKKARRGEGGIV